MSTVLSGPADLDCTVAATFATGQPSLRKAAAPALPAFRFDVAIIGLGYVGLPTSVGFHAAGCRVLGVDVDGQRLAAINDQRVDLIDSDRTRLARALDDPRCEFTSDGARLAEAAAVIVCVPTPVDEHRLPELGILRRACATVVSRAVPGQTLVLTSTSYIGCTKDLLVAPLAERGLRAGNEVFVAFSPERIDPGNDRYDHEQVPRVVGGETPACADAATAVLRRCTEVVHRVDTVEVAEMAKMVENTFRAVNIALANEFADICSTLNLDVRQVIEAAATKPFGFMPFFPGPGVGGQCIPCDPHYLLWQLRKERLSTPLIEQAMSAISGRPRQVVEHVRQALSAMGRGFVGARILVIGVAYKPDVTDLRESPALEIIATMLDAGATVAYHDPLFAALTLPDGRAVAAVDDPAESDADLVVLHTAHSKLDLEWLADGRAVLDATYRLGSAICGPVR